MIPGPRTASGTRQLRLSGENPVVVNDAGRRLGPHDGNMGGESSAFFFRLDGRRGLLTILQSDSPFGRPEQDRLLTIATADGMFYLMFVAPLDQYRNAQQTFDRMVGS